MSPNNTVKRTPNTLCGFGSLRPTPFGLRRRLPQALGLMNKLLAIIALYCAAISPAFSCSIPAGEYEAFVESEFSLKIRVLEDQKIEFEHASYWAGDHDISEAHTFQGRFECKNGKVAIELSSGNFSAGYRHASLKELGFSSSASSMAIEVHGCHADKFPMCGWIFWPEAFLREWQNEP